MIKELKTNEDLKKILDFYGENIISADTSFEEVEGKIEGFSSVAVASVIQLHSTPRFINKLFYTALGKAMKKSNIIYVLCNNESLEKHLQKEGFKDLGFKILTKEV